MFLVIFFNDLFNYFMGMRLALKIVIFYPLSQSSIQTLHFAVFLWTMRTDALVDKSRSLQRLVEFPGHVARTVVALNKRRFAAEHRVMLQFVHRALRRQ